MPVEISKRQFELIDRTNAKETTVIRSRDGIRTNTAVFEGGKIVSIKIGHIYDTLDGGYFFDEDGYSLDVNDIPEIKAYCLERFLPLESIQQGEHFFSVVVIERLGKPSTPRTRKKKRTCMQGFNTATEREMLMIVSSSKGSVKEQENIITNTPADAYKLGQKIMHDNMSKLQEGEVMEIEIVDVESDKTMMLLDSGSEVHKKQ